MISRKNLPVTILITLLLAGSVSAAYGQNAAPASIGATIVIPIAITKTADMDFGNVAVHAVSPGTECGSRDRCRARDAARGPRR